MGWKNGPNYIAPSKVLLLLLFQNMWEIPTNMATIMVNLLRKSDVDLYHVFIYFPALIWHFVTMVGPCWIHALVKMQQKKSNAFIFCLSVLEMITCLDHLNNKVLVLTVLLYMTIIKCCVFPGCTAGVAWKGKRKDLFMTHKGGFHCMYKGSTNGAITVNGAKL